MTNFRVQQKRIIIGILFVLIATLVTSTAFADSHVVKVTIVSTNDFHGALIGRVGETASLTGPNLYFEVREGTDALNPLRWLQRER